MLPGNALIDQAMRDELDNAGSADKIADLDPNLSHWPANRMLRRSMSRPVESTRAMIFPA
jgi:hypothetical protein